MKLKYPAIIGLLTTVCVLSCTKAGDIYQYYKDPGLSADNRFDRSQYISINYLNNFEIQAGRNSLLYKGSDPRVKSFGGILWNDHQNARTDLVAIAAITWPTLALADTTSLDYQRKLFYLSSFAGHNYDTAYLGVVSRDHAIAINLYNQGIVGGRHPETRNYCTKWLPTMVLRKKMTDSLLLLVK
jgi:predicted outer membrane protein